MDGYTVNDFRAVRKPIDEATDAPSSSERSTNRLPRELEISSEPLIFRAGRLRVHKIDRHLKIEIGQVAAELEAELLPPADAKKLIKWLNIGGVT